MSGFHEQTYRSNGSGPAYAPRFQDENFQHNQHILLAASTQQSQNVDPFQSEFDSSFYQMPGDADLMQSRSTSLNFSSPANSVRFDASFPIATTQSQPLSNNRPTQINTLPPARNTPSITTAPQQNLTQPSAQNSSQSAEFLSCLHQMCDVGFTAEHSTIALKRCNNNVEEAIAFCLEHDDDAMQQYIAEERIAHNMRLRELTGGTVAPSSTAGGNGAAPMRNPVATSPNPSTATVALAGSVKSKNVFKRMIGLKSKHSAPSNEVVTTTTSTSSTPSSPATTSDIMSSPGSINTPNVVNPATSVANVVPPPNSFPSRILIPPVQQLVRDTSTQSTVGPPPAVNPNYHSSSLVSGAFSPNDEDEAVLNYSAMEEEILLSQVLAASALEARSATSPGSSVTAMAGASGGAALIRRMSDNPGGGGMVRQASMTPQRPAKPVVIAPPPVTVGQASSNLLDFTPSVQPLVNTVSPRGLLSPEIVFDPQRASIQKTGPLHNLYLPVTPPPIAPLDLATVPNVFSQSQCQPLSVISSVNSFQPSLPVRGNDFAPDAFQPTLPVRSNDFAAEAFQPTLPVRSNDFAASTRNAELLQLGLPARQLGVTSNVPLDANSGTGGAFEDVFTPTVAFSPTVATPIMTADNMKDSVSVPATSSNRNSLSRMDNFDNSSKSSDNMSQAVPSTVSQKSSSILESHRNPPVLDCPNELLEFGYTPSVSFHIPSSMPAADARSRPAKMLSTIMTPPSSRAMEISDSFEDLVSCNSSTSTNVIDGSSTLNTLNSGSVSTQLDSNSTAPADVSGNQIYNNISSFFSGMSNMSMSNIETESKVNLSTSPVTRDVNETLSMKKLEINVIPDDTFEFKVDTKQTDILVDHHQQQQQQLSQVSPGSPESLVSQQLDVDVQNMDMLRNNSSSQKDMLLQDTLSQPPPVTPGVIAPGNTQKSKQNFLDEVDSIKRKNSGSGSRLSGSVKILPVLPAAPAAAVTSTVVDESFDIASFTPTLPEAPFAPTVASEVAIKTSSDIPASVGQRGGFADAMSASVARNAAALKAAGLTAPPAPPSTSVSDSTTFTASTSYSTTSSVASIPAVLTMSMSQDMISSDVIQQDADNETENEAESETGLLTAEHDNSSVATGELFDRDSDAVAVADFAVFNSSDAEEETESYARYGDESVSMRNAVIASLSGEYSNNSSNSNLLAVSDFASSTDTSTRSNNLNDLMSIDGGSSRSFASNSLISPASARSAGASNSNPTFQLATAATLSIANSSSAPVFTELYNEIQTYLQSVRKRRHLACTVNEHNGKFTAQISLKQIKLAKNEGSPQGTRSNSVIIGTCTTRELATDLCLTLAPPEWSGKQDSQTCTLCQVSFSMFKKGHHCRNCGFVVCVNCSNKSWPSSMLPTTYHDNEKYVRICASCQSGTEMFVKALRQGDYQSVLSLYNGANVNLHCPMSVYVNNAHPVHCAAAGGNLQLLQWLIETKKCSVKDNVSKKQLVTGKGLSVLAVAAQAGHVAIMRYLIHNRKCNVLEITEMSILHRALHVALEAPGPMPPYVPPKGIREEELLSESNTAMSSTGIAQNTSEGNNSNSSVVQQLNRSTSRGAPPLRPPTSSESVGYAPNQVSAPLSPNSAGSARSQSTLTPNRLVASTTSQRTQLVAPLGPLNGPRAVSTAAGVAPSLVPTSTAHSPTPIIGATVVSVDNSSATRAAPVTAPVVNPRLPSYLTHSQAQVALATSMAPVVSSGPVVSSVHAEARNVIAPRALYNETPVNIATAEAVTASVYTSTAANNGRGAPQDAPVAATAFLTSDIVFAVTQHDANFTSESASGRDDTSRTAGGLQSTRDIVSIRHIAVASPYVASASTTSPTPIVTGTGTSFPELIVEGSAAPTNGTAGRRWFG